MKAKNLITVLLLSLFFIPFYSNAQGRKIEIVLTVDVDNINKNNIDETCSFGQPKEVSNEEFTTDVQIGDQVKWKIVRKEGSKGSAKLQKFKHDKGKKFFNKDSIPQSSGNIKGVINEGAGEPGEVEKYSLEFKVKKKGENRWETYSIDPKLKLISQE